MSGGRPALDTLTPLQPIKLGCRRAWLVKGKDPGRLVGARPLSRGLDQGVGCLNGASVMVRGGQDWAIGYLVGLAPGKGDRTGQTGWEALRGCLPYGQHISSWVS